MAVSAEGTWHRGERLWNNKNDELARMGDASRFLVNAPPKRIGYKLAQLRRPCRLGPDGSAFERLSASLSLSRRCVSTWHGHDAYCCYIAWNYICQTAGFGSRIFKRVPEAFIFFEHSARKFQTESFNKISNILHYLQKKIISKTRRCESDSIGTSEVQRFCESTSNRITTCGSNSVFGVSGDEISDFGNLSLPRVAVYLLTLGTLTAASSTVCLNTVSLSLTSRLINGPSLTTIQK